MGNPILIKQRLLAGERLRFKKDAIDIDLFCRHGVFYLQTIPHAPHTCRSFSEAVLALLDVLGVFLPAIEGEASR